MHFYVTSKPSYSLCTEICYNTLLISEQLVQEAIASGHTSQLLALCGVLPSDTYQPVEFQEHDPLGEQCLKSYEVDFRAIKRSRTVCPNKNLLSHVIRLVVFLLLSLESY